MIYLFIINFNFKVIDMDC